MARGHNQSAEERARRIKPRFRLSDIYSVDTAAEILDNLERRGLNSLVQQARAAMHRVVTQFKDEGGRTINEFDRLDKFFTDYIVMGHGDPEVQHGYPPPLLPGIMKKYGVHWRDFDMEYGGGRSGEKADPRNITRDRLRNACEWMAAAYWLTPDWLYDANYVEMVSYRRWVNAKYLTQPAWGGIVRENPCIMEEGVRTGMQRWTNEVLRPWFQERMQQAMKIVAGKRRVNIDIESAVTALFYKTLYDKTVDAWYGRQVAALKKGVSFVSEIPPRTAKRRVAEKRKGERQVRDAAPAHSRGRSENVRDMRDPRVQKREKAARKKLKVVKSAPAPWAVDAPSPGSSTKPTSWNKIKATAYGENFADYLSDILAAGFADQLPSNADDDALIQALWRAWRGAPGGKGADFPGGREYMRSYLSRVRNAMGQSAAAPQREQTYPQEDADERAQLEREAQEYQREETRREIQRERELTRDPDPEPEPEPEPEYAAKAEVGPPEDGNPFPMAKGA